MMPASPAMFLEMRHLRANRRIAMPWKDGGGFTHEVAIYPANTSWADFGWRISIASMPQDAIFSSLPGVARILAVLEGTLRLTIDGEQQPALYPMALPAYFDGASAVEAVILSTAVLNLNLMVRRNIWAARLSPLHDAPASCGHHRVLVATGPIEFAPMGLGHLDALQIEPGETMPTIPPNARGWIAEISPVCPRTAY
jgi:uncharacterized protein